MPLKFSPMLVLLLSVHQAEPEIYLSHAKFHMTAIPRNSPGQVSFVLDGDSLIWNQNGHHLTLRLYGIDAPERGQALADQARSYLITLLRNQPVQVEFLYQDRYQRLISRIRLANGQDVGQEMVKAGLAWWYRQYAPQDKMLAQLETMARLAHRGIWSQASPQPPWQYRILQHSR